MAPNFGIQQPWMAVAIMAGLYLAWLVAGRLVFSPLAAFPGPRLGALSNWYEFYYDVFKQGKFTAHIQELHRKYGPIIRITPTELHIDDPDYFNQLYGRAGGRREKSSYFAARFGHVSNTFTTVAHELHRNRRKAISPFFSAAKIAEFQPVIREKVDKFCLKLESYRDGQVVRIGRGCMALTTDIITEYSFSKSYNQLDSPDFEDVMHEALITTYIIGNFALHFPIVFPILDLLPDWLMRWSKPATLSVVSLRSDLARRIRMIRDGINQGYKTAKHPTIFHELINSDLPEEEKTDARLGSEAQLIVCAGLISTSWALSVATFYLSHKPLIATKLRKEIDAAGGPGLDWHRLERLPFLNGVVHESIRLSGGVVTRDPRVAPDEELHYGKWTIPRNTPVSMTTVDVLMNDKIFADPASFAPERWIENPELEKYFVPFGKGTRQCLGINLAFAELYIAIAMVFTRFEFELFETDESDVKMEHAYLVPYPKWESKGIRVKIKKQF